MTVDRLQSCSSNSLQQNYNVEVMIKSENQGLRFTNHKSIKSASKKAATQWSKNPENYKSKEKCVGSLFLVVNN